MKIKGQACEHDLETAVRERDAVKEQCLKLAEELAAAQTSIGDDSAGELARMKQAAAEQSLRIEAYEKKLMNNAEQLAKVGRLYFFFYMCVCIYMYI